MKYQLQIKPNNLITHILLCLIPFSGIAQSVSEGSLISTQNLPGTARTKAMGGAQVATGSVSASTLNPASGLFMNRSAFVFSPEYIIRKSNMEFLGGETTEITSNLNANCIGMVMNSASLGDITSDDIPPTEDSVVESNKKEYAIGVVLNRTNNFNLEQGYDIFNYQNSMTEYFGDLSEAAGLENNMVIDVDSLYKLEEMALITYLTNLDQNEIYSIGAAEGEGIYQKYLHHSDGSLTNLDFSYALKFNQKFGIGAAASVRIYRFKYSTEITEEDREDVYPYFTRMRYEKTYSTSGVGFNWKLGAIYKPSKALQIGVSYQMANKINSIREAFIEMSGTYINHPEINNSPINVGDSVSVESARSIILESAYSLKTPARLTAGFVLKDKDIGQFALDVEFMQFIGNMFYDRGNEDPSLNYEVLNQETSEALKNNLNLRMGGEINVGDNRFRAGFSLYNLIKNDYLQSRTYLTFGYGLEKDNYFLNFTYLKQFNNSVYFSYPVDGVREQGTINAVGTDIVVGYGLRF